MVINNNTIRYAQIEYLKSTLEEVVDDGTDFIYCLGNHDMATFTKRPGEKSKSSSSEYYAVLSESEQEFFASELDPAVAYDNGFDMNRMRRYGVGYYKIENTHFITIDCTQYWVSDKGSYSDMQLDWLDNALANIEQQYPNDTVFLITHNPVQDTVLKSGGTGGANDLKPILVKYPQVITVTGHIHQSCYSEFGISQENGYTCIEGCSVKYTSTYDYDNERGFNVRYSQDSYSTSLGLLITVYDNSEVKIERLNFTANEEAGEAWIIPAIGQADRHSAYSNAIRNAKNTAPYFDDGSEFSAKKAKLSDVLNVKFTPATDDEYIVYAYRVKANYVDGTHKELLVDSGFALNEKVSEYCVSFENASDIESVSVIAEDALYKQSAPVVLDKSKFSNEGDYVAVNYTNDVEDDKLGSIKVGSTLFSASENFYEENGLYTNYKSMRAEGSLYFTKMFATDYAFKYTVSKMRLNKAYTINGFMYSPYRLGANLATFEYNGRVYSIVANLNFGYYANTGNDIPPDQRIHTNQLEYYLVVGSSGVTTYANVYSMNSYFGIEPVQIPEDIKGKLRSDEGAEISVRRNGSQFKIMVDGVVIDQKDFAGGYYVGGKYAEFTAVTDSAFGVHCQGAEAYFSDADAELIWYGC